MDPAGISRDRCFNHVHQNIGDKHAKRINSRCATATRLARI